MKGRKSLKHLLRSKAQRCGLLLRALLMSHSAPAPASLMKPHKVRNCWQIIHTHSGQGTLDHDAPLLPSWNAQMEWALEVGSPVQHGDNASRAERVTWFMQTVLQTQALYWQMWDRGKEALARFWEAEKQWKADPFSLWYTIAWNSACHWILSSFPTTPLEVKCVLTTILLWSFYFLVFPQVSSGCSGLWCTSPWTAPALSSTFCLQDSHCCFWFGFKSLYPQHTEHTPKSLWTNRGWKDVHF